MKKKLLIILIILIFSTAVYAASVKWSAMAANVAVADDDVMLLIDTGTGASQKITVLNLFDTIDTFAELNTITADKTLVNEEDAVTWDSIITFSTTITLSDAATIDQSANNYIDFAENGDTLQFYYDATDLGIIWSDGALNLQNAEDGTNAIVNIMGKDAGEYGILRILSDGDDKYIELYNDDTDAVLTNSAGNIIINPVGLGIVVGDNGDEDYTITFDGDTSDGILNYDEDNADFEFDQDIATTGNVNGVTLTGSTSIIGPLFDAAGAEDMDYGSADVTDHTFTTDDSTFIIDGGITVSTGDVITLGAVQWNSADEIDGTKIKDADYGDIDVSAGGAWTLDTDSVADNEIDYTAVTGADLTLTDAGAITSTGTITATVGFDIVGAADIDYGSIDVTDHTFTTDDSTFIIDGGITVSTGDNITLGAVQWNSADEIDGTKIKDADYGDIAVSAGGAWTLDGDAVDESHIADNGIDSEHYNNGSIDLVHLAAAVYAVDIVTTAPVTGATDNVLVGADADVTIALDFTAAWNFGGAAGSEWVNDGNPTTDAAGELALDTTITDHQPLWQYYDGGENMTIIAIDTAQLPALDNEIIKYDAGADKFVLEADAGAGATDWDDIGDAGGDGTIDFGGTEQTITSTLDGVNENVLMIDHTDADVTNVTTLIMLRSVDDNDPSLYYMRIQDNTGVATNNIFSIGADGDLRTDGDVTVEGAITEAGVAVPNVNEIDWVAAAEMADADHGDVAWSGGDASVEAATIADSVYASCYVGIFQAATGADQPFYTDGALTYDASNGTLAATEFSGGGGSLTGIDAATGDSATAFFDAGTIEHEYGGLQANLAAYTGLIGITGADTTVEVDTSAEMATAITDETGSGKLTFATAPVFVTSVQLTGADADPAAAAGTIAYDSTIGVMSGGGLRWYDDNSVRLIVDLETDPSNDDYVVTYDAAADGFYMLDSSGFGGATAWDDIGDADAAGSIDFVTHTQTIDIGVTDTGGPKSGLILDVTGLGAGVTDVIALEITTATDDDSDYIPIAIYDDSGVANDLLFQVAFDGSIYMQHAGRIWQNNDNHWTFTENGDRVDFYYDASNVFFQWSDGYLGIRNMENGVDGIVQMGGKDAGEKGILRVMSDGDDNYIELHHDDTDGHIITDTGDIHIEPAGGDTVFTGGGDFGGADLELPQAAPAVPDADGEVELDFTDGKMVIQHGAAHAELGGATDIVMGTLIKSWSGTIYAPDGVNDVITVKAINSIEFPHGVVITAVYLGVSEDSNYVLTVQNFDDFDTINAGDGTIDTVTYTADTTGEIIDPTPTYATIAAGQIIMISIPATDVDWIHFEIYYYEPAA